MTKTQTFGNALHTNPEYQKKANLSRQHSKVRVLAVMKIICEADRITIDKIRERLEDEYGIYASRPAVYSDLLAIENFIPLDSYYGPNGGYQKRGESDESILE